MVKFSIVIPCFNEETTLLECVEKVLNIQDDELALEILIVDDASEDESLAIAKALEKKHKEIIVLQHKINQGKGAALRTGFKMATGNFVGVQDADLEYDPAELKKLIQPLINDEADVILGSRFLATGIHRVIYFWHYMGNRFLTFLSNMFTDLNLTDMETCYKVFKREVIQEIEIEENRFGFEPEIIAKIAHKRLRIFEAGISYRGRTYEEGKKIGIKDGIRALYCVIRYNASHAPLFLQFMIYLFIGGAAAMANLGVFLTLHFAGITPIFSIPIAFLSAAILNYYLCISILFKHKTKWNSKVEIILFIILVLSICGFDYIVTASLLSSSVKPINAKLIATGLGLFLNFFGRRFLIFPEPGSGPWQAQVRKKSKK
ncbi:MAG: bifunctional glycosyltransferase family 2/GtrA family protein [Pseudomonadota bacterium]